MRFLDKMTNCQNDKLRGMGLKGGLMVEGGLWLKPEPVKERVGGEKFWLKLDPVREREEICVRY